MAIWLDFHFLFCVRDVTFFPAPEQAWVWREQLSTVGVQHPRHNCWAHWLHELHSICQCSSLTKSQSLAYLLLLSAGSIKIDAFLHVYFEDNSAKTKMCFSVENPIGIFLINYPLLYHDNMKIFICTHAMFLVNVHLQMIGGKLKGHIWPIIKIK